MKRRTDRNKNIENRRERRRRDQEAEYGRDEFLFGTSDDEYADDEYADEDDYYSADDYNSAEDEEYSDGEYDDYEEDAYSNDAVEELPEFDPEDPDFFTRDIDTDAVNDALEFADEIEEEIADEIIEEPAKAIAKAAAASGASAKAVKNTKKKKEKKASKASRPVKDTKKKKDKKASKRKKEEYFEEEYSDEEYYEDEYYEDEYYGDEYENEYSDDEYYEEEYSDEEYYEDEYYGDEDFDYEEVRPSARDRRKGKKKYKKESFFSRQSMADRLIMATGICVFIIAAVAGTIFFLNKTKQAQIEEFANIGSVLDGIDIIGEEGIASVVSVKANLDSEPVEEIEEEDEPEEEIDEEEKEPDVITIVMNASSIQSDIKVKFNSKDTGKLVTEIPFEITVSGDNGKEYKWTDENKDGLIYHTEVPNGNYKIKMSELDKEKYDKYVASTETVSLKVTDSIEYKKVDVSDEVKKESEVNVAAEDTAVQDAVVESTNKDTVEWVESTKTLISGSENGYEEIDKKNITDPNTTSKAKISRIENDWMMPYMASRNEDIVTSESTDEIKALGEEDDESEDDDDDTSSDDEGDNKDSDDNTDENGGIYEDIDDEEGDKPAIKLSTTSIRASVGETVTVKATVSGTDKTEVSFSVDDWDLADVVSDEGNEGKIKALEPGKVTIRARLISDKSVYQTCELIITESKEEDEGKADKALKDNSGKQVYIKDANGNFVKASASDYATASKFYIKSDAEGDAVYKYTGWQTIDGSTYFFDKDGNYVTGEQVIQGAKYSFDSSGRLSSGSGTMGIDVSKWNGDIDWSAVKASGVSYAIIRCGYRGSTTGALIEDPKFRTNIQGARAAGLKVGAYFFTQAVSEAEAVEEASMAISLCSGYGLDLPLFLDVESSGGRGDKLDTGSRTAVCKAFCQTVKNSGLSTGIYANKTWLTSKISASALTSYKIWLAQYSASPTYSSTRIDYWQYSKSGSVAGIKGKVDLNIKY